MSLLASLRRVLAWRMHAVGDILDPQDSYHQPVRDPRQDDRDWVLELITNGQPMPWSQLRVWSALSGPTLRDICNDLIDEDIIVATIHGLILVSHDKPGS